MDVVFAKTRHTYASYIDFWKVVELSGYPIVYVDEIDPKSDNAYIITPLNGEWQQGWKHPHARIVLWDLEWRDVRPDIPGVAEVWASDKGYAKKLGAKYVLLGSHPGLCPEAPREERQYDVVMLAYMNFRRGGIEVMLRGEGLTVAPNYGAELEDRRRHDVLMSSRLMLHVHQHEHIHTVAPTRWMAAAAYRLPILSETADNPSPFTQTCVWAEYDRLPTMAKMLLTGQYYRELDELAAQFHAQLCIDNNFGKCVENAI